MKSIRNSILFISAVVLPISATAQTDYYTRMEALSAQYDSAADADARKKALNEMTALDTEYKGAAVKQMWSELDEKTATAADYRRVGLSMAAAGEKKACKWSFRKGAELGDPYCVNQALLEQLTELSYTEAALYLFPKIKTFTLPLLHNMALALYVHNTPESLAIAKPLAEAFFSLFDGKTEADRDAHESGKFATGSINYNVYDYTEYIDYFGDSEALKMVGKCWQISRSYPDGKILRQYYENSK